MHFTNDLLDNKVTRTNLSLIKPSKINLGFIDVHNIKGIHDFPIYNDKSGLGGSRAPPRVDSTLFSSHPSENYKIKNIHHEKPPLEEIKTLYNFDAKMKIPSMHTRNEFSGMFNKLYGIPFNTIHIENDAFKMAGIDGITEKQFQKKRWRAEGRGGDGDDGDGGDGDGGSGAMDVDDIMNDPRMQHVVGSGSASASASSSASASASSSSSSSASHVGGGPVGPRHDLISSPQPTSSSSSSSSQPQQQPQPQTSPVIRPAFDRSAIKPTTGKKRRQSAKSTLGPRKSSKQNTFITEHFDVDPNPSFEKGSSSDDPSISFQSSKTTPRKPVQLGKRKDKPFESIESPRKKNTLLTTAQQIIQDASFQKEAREVLKKIRKQEGKDEDKEIIDESTYVKYDIIVDQITTIVDSIGDNDKISAKNILDINNLLKSQKLHPIHKNTRNKDTVINHLTRYER